ncbi:MAG: TonB-dependent receptor [Ignavibacteriales bacterium]|nr:TonB-dependent receptor [Ignavibacteriales bacterium]
MSDRIRFILTVILSIILVIVLSAVLFSQEPKGTINGKIISQNSKEDLVGSTILILDTKLGTTTNLDGSFTIPNVPVGNYKLEIRSVGYESLIRTDVFVRPERITQIEIELKETLIQTEGVTVTAGYFQKIDADNLGLVNFNSEEIKRSPGSMGDVSRIILSLPSTSKVSDENNDLVVRGGSPSENGFFVDGIPIPNINHFPAIGSTGGPIGILNVDLIDNFNFLTSGFSSSYGDKLSSIVDIKYREGNKEEFDLQADLNWAGFGGGAEGPLPGKIGSWMLSFKRSYLDFFQKAAGMGMLIRYGDAQGKVTYDINKNHKITLLDIFADDYEKFNRDDAIEQGSSYYGMIKNYQNTAGVSWRALWNKDFYSTTNISLSTQSFKNDFNKVSTSEKHYSSNNLENSFNLKNSNYLQLNKWNKLELGIDINFSVGKYDYTMYSDTNRLGTVDPTNVVNRKIHPQRAGIFLSYVVNPFDRFTASIGIRSDYYSLNEVMKWSPRLSIAYDLTDQLRLSANTGIFYQQLPMVLLSQKEKFKKLNSVTAYHFGAGLEFLVTPDTKLSLEVYDKEYENLPLTKQDPSLCVIDGGLSGNSFGNYDNLENIGKGFTRGIELLIQKKLAEDFYGIISGSYFRSRYQDYNSAWRNRIYDNKFIFSFIVGYKPTNDWEFSLRWTYAGGIPYTPFNIEKSSQARLGIIDDSKINEERYPDYHSLNIRVDKKFFFSSQSVDIYLSIWNTYNRKNITEYVWNADKNLQETIFQWSIMPIFGIEWEL